jgi:hypothetical protein
MHGQSPWGKHDKDHLMTNGAPFAFKTTTLRGPQHFIRERLLQGSENLVFLCTHLVQEFGMGVHALRGTEDERLRLWMEFDPHLVVC